MLVRATEAQKLERDSLCHAEWGQRLTLEQFRDREVRLRAHPWAQQTMTTWLWLGPAQRALASCETFRMESFLRPDPASSSPVEGGHTYGVASVFTEPALRGRGYAGEMMRALVETLRREDPRTHASILFSDVGAQLYERAGYAAVPGMDRRFEPDAGDPAQGVDELITEEGLAEAWARVPRPDERFVVWPTAGQLDWHLERERIYAELLASPRPSACGARVGDSFACWVGDLKNRRLMVQALSATSGEAAVALMRCARRIAHAAGLRSVRAWEQPSSFGWPAGADGGELHQRDGELAMIAPVHPGLRPADWRIVPRALWI